MASYCHQGAPQSGREIDAWATTPRPLGRLHGERGEGSGGRYGWKRLGHLTPSRRPPRFPIGAHTRTHSARREGLACRASAERVHPSPSAEQV